MGLTAPYESAIFAIAMDFSEGASNMGLPSEAWPQPNAKQAVWMTKAEIVQAVYTKLGGFSKKESADLVDLVFETMKETLGRGEKIKISGFGNFVLRDKRQRQGRNPQTGDPIVITERRVLNFKASQLLKQALNDDGAFTPMASGGASAASVVGQSAVMRPASSAENGTAKE